MGFYSGFNCSRLLSALFLTPKGVLSVQVASISLSGSYFLPNLSHILPTMSVIFVNIQTIQQDRFYRL